MTGIKEYKNINADYIINDGKEYLLDLKKINIFIGANNSGKSRFLRQIFRNDEFHDYTGRIRKAKDKIKNIYDDAGDKYKNGGFFLEEFLKIKDIKESSFDSSLENFRQTLETTASSSGDSRRGSFASKKETSEYLIQKLNENNVFSNKGEKIESDLIYIPILRGLRKFSGENSNEVVSYGDIYEKQTKKEYEFNEKNYIFSGLKVYDEIRDMLLGNKDQRKFIKEFEAFLSDNFFESDITLIPSENPNVLKVDIGNENDRAIFDVGDGIQSIIINTFQAFKNKDKNVIIFIEEPEMLMHPYMQRILIKTFVEKFQKLQVFLTTHSNHFLDLTYDYPENVSLFSFEKNVEENKFYIKNITNNVRILDLLGVRNSSVFLSNCVIWTEGVTDRMLLKYLLEETDKEFSGKFLEDKHYAFAEYGGSNLPNFDFVGGGAEEQINIKESLSKTNFIVADNDNLNINTDTSKKAKRLKNLQLTLGNDNFSAEHIEIENLIPFYIWVEVIKKMQDGKGYSLKDSHAKNKKAFGEGLGSKNIGSLIKEYLIEKDGDKRKRLGYFDDNKNILCLGSEKKEIMKKVIECFDEKPELLEKLPKQTDSLLGKIKNFVKNSNS